MEKSEVLAHTTVLDHGYVKLIDTWGSDERIIEAARMSTNKGFTAWEDRQECSISGGAHVYDVKEYPTTCGVCHAPSKRIPGDTNLLRYLYTHKHMTPFEMCGMTLEVKAPIFVFREWHRHRTQSYNEMSARYIPLPNENYVPGFENLMERAIEAQSSKNAQARASNAKGDPVEEEDLRYWLAQLVTVYETADAVYQKGLSLGVPKELARLAVPVARYSRMRASANLRNWLAFLTLRCDPNAQFEIRQYAEAVSGMVYTHFPRTWQLFNEGREA